MDDHTKRSPRPVRQVQRLRWTAVANGKGSLWWERVDVIQGGGPCRAGGGQLSSPALGRN